MPSQPVLPPDLIPPTLDKRPDPLETLEARLPIHHFDLVDFETGENMLVDLEINFEGGRWSGQVFRAVKRK